MELLIQSKNINSHENLKLVYVAVEVISMQNLELSPQMEQLDVNGCLEPQLARELSSTSVEFLM